MGRTKHTAKRTPAPKERQSGIGPEESAAGNRTRKKTRFKPGTVALREIRRYQKSTEFLIPAAPFIRTVKELTNHFSQTVTRWEAEALVALQESTEEFVVAMFRDAMLCAFHAKRVTLMKQDLQLARRLGGLGRPW